MSPIFFGDTVYIKEEMWRRTQQHTTVVQQVSEMFEHCSLIDTSGATEVTQEATACDHHISRRVLARTTNAAYTPAIRKLISRS